MRYQTLLIERAKDVAGYRFYTDLAPTLACRKEDVHRLRKGELILSDDQVRALAALIDEDPDYWVPRVQARWEAIGRKRVG